MEHDDSLSDAEFREFTETFDPAPVPAVTRDRLERLFEDSLRHRDDADFLDWLLADVLALLAEAPQPAPVGELVDGIPEHLHVDLESTIHQHMGDDGQSDETNDWVTDLMSALCPLIERALALAEAPQPKVLAKGAVDGDGQGVSIDYDQPDLPPRARVLVVEAPTPAELPWRCGAGHVCCDGLHDGPFGPHVLDPSDCPACGYIEDDDEAPASPAPEEPTDA